MRVCEFAALDERGLLGGLAGFFSGLCLDFDRHICMWLVLFGGCVSVGGFVGGRKRLDEGRGICE